MPEQESQHGRDSRQASDDDRLAKFATRAVDAFREEDGDAYAEVVKAFEGRSADIAVFGHGRFNLSVEKGQVRVAPRLRGGANTARGAIYPETLIALAEGRLTPLEAHFKGDLIARAPSAELHRAYGYFVKFAETALRSARLQELLNEFRASLTT
jgi:hypothetical protein